MVGELDQEVAVREQSSEEETHDTIYVTSEASKFNAICGMAEKEETSTHNLCNDLTIKGFNDDEDLQQGLSHGDYSEMS